MAVEFTPQRSAEMVRDIFESRSDLAGLAERHGLEPGDLAAWIALDENRRCLSGLCLLADFQTQLMLSRYRQVAVTELIKQATGGGDDGHVSTEQARKACVDLLKADLNCATPSDAPASAASMPWDATAEGLAELHAIREALFGDEHASDNTDTHGEHQ